MEPGNGLVSELNITDRDSTDNMERVVREINRLYNTASFQHLERKVVLRVSSPDRLHIRNLARVASFANIPLRRCRERHCKPVPAHGRTFSLSFTCSFRQGGFVLSLIRVRVRFFFSGTGRCEKKHEGKGERNGIKKRTEMQKKSFLNCVSPGNTVV